jgi:branched-chain amino acid transport system substrate-binding protein
MRCRRLAAWLAPLFLLIWPSLAQAQSPIRIGLALALTGQYSREASYQREAYSLWEKEINRQGGLLGRPVALLVLDDRSDPSLSARLYEELIQEERVDLVLCPYSSSVTFPVSAVVERLRHPMLAGGASAIEIWQQGYRYIFGVYAPAPAYFEGMIELAAERGVKSVAVLNDGSAFARSSVLGVIRMARDRGIRVVVNEKYASPLTDARPALLKVRQLWPELLVVGSYLKDAVLITRQAREVDLRVKGMAFSVGAAMPEFAEHLGKNAEYVFGPSMWEPSLKTLGNREFVERYRERWGRDPDYHAATAWAAVTVLETAVRRAGSLDRERIRRILTDTEMETILPGRFEVDRSGLQVGHRALIVQWQKGRKEIVWPRQHATARPIFPAPPWKRR